jgi:hypothetical protein
MSRRDYRSEIRSQIRSYRTYLIEHASQSIDLNDSFYSNKDLECRETGLSFNMDKNNGILGIILKTAALAKLSEVSAGKLNPGLSKELAAISQLIVKELGLKIDGDVEVTDEDGVTTTKGKFSLQLTEIADEQIDEATKKRDEDEVMAMEFTRNLGDNYVGDFNATMAVSHRTADDKIEMLQGDMHVERKEVEAKLVHNIDFKLGVKGMDPTYSRAMLFEQVEGTETQLKVTDTLNPGMSNAVTYVTILDVEAGTQCKVSMEGGDPVLPVPSAAPSPVPTVTPTATSTPKLTPEPTPEPTPGVEDGKGKPIDNDDDAKPTASGQKPGQTPGQKPGQNPGQKPGQNPGQHVKE